MGKIKTTHRAAGNIRKTALSAAKNNQSAPSPESFNLIHYLLNHIGDELMLIDREARIVFVNDDTVNGLGIPREKLFQKRVVDFMGGHLSIRGWQNKFFYPIKKSRQTQNYRLERISGTGERQTIDITAAYMPYRSEEYILSVGRNVTKELLLQGRLEESQDLYRLISDGATEGIFACDLRGHLTYVNPALEKLVGVAAANLRGEKFLQYIPADFMSKVVACFKQACQGMENIQEEIDVLNRKGERIPVEISVSPLYKGKEIVSVHAIVRDIRNRKNMEEIVRQAEKMQAIQSFVGGMAKEIRDPLFAVMSLAGKLSEKYRNRDFEYMGYNEFKEMLRVLEQINSRARYSFETVERLIELNKKRSGLAKDQCYVNDILQNNLRLRRGTLEQNNIQITLSLSQQLPPVQIGKLEFGQVIDNLINNAIQAMPGGGVISIRTKYLKSFGRVEVNIQDSGVGISRDDLPHIFEPFFSSRPHAKEKNAGLGLPIVSQLLKAVQGDIQVQSSLRQGTSVTIALPAVKLRRRR